MGIGRYYTHYMANWRLGVNFHQSDRVDFCPWLGGAEAAHWHHGDIDRHTEPLVLSNPMTYNFTGFVDGALGPCYLVIFLIRDTSQQNTRRIPVNNMLRIVLLQLKYPDGKSKQLPALYTYYNRLLQVVPADIDTLKLAMWLVIY